MSEKDQRFYIATGNRVACLDKATGEVIWQTDLDGSLNYASMVLDDERILVSGHKRAACLDRATGALRWQTEIKGLSSPNTLALDKSVPGGQIILSCGGLLFSLWAETGELLWDNGLKGWGYNHICLRVPDAITSQPKHQVISTGKSSTTVVTENTQDP